MISKKNLAALALAVSVSSIATVTAQAQFTNGDLGLWFQNPGGATGATQLLFIDLGDTALNFRGTIAGLTLGDDATGPTDQNIVNIGAQLAAAFGANWASETTLRAGLAGVWGNDAFADDLVNGDPNRTLYVSRPRNTMGTFGQHNSTPASANGTNDTGMTNASGQMIGGFSAFTASGLSIAQIDVGSSTMDDVTSPPGSTDFTIFSSTTQQVGAAGTRGTLGGISDIEFALDLWRILAKTDAPGQVAGGLRVGSYEGTVVINSLGDVSFLGATPVPEPSSALLFAGVVGAAGMIRRRRA